MPYGKPWLPGAVSPTSVAFERNILIDNKHISAGEYSLWIVPNETADWEVIFSKATDKKNIIYQDGHDALKLSVPVEISEPRPRRLEYFFDGVEVESRALVLAWDGAVISMNLKCSEN